VELRNPLSKAQLDHLRPRPLVVEFDFNIVPSTVHLGKVLAGIIVSTCFVEIQDSFVGTVGVTVGDLSAQGRFQALSDNDPEHANQYGRDNNFSYSVDTDVYVFISGTATSGHARVILYLE